VFVRLSVCPIILPQQRRAADLLLSAVWTRNIDEQRRRVPGSNGAAAWRFAAYAGSAMLAAELKRLNTDLFLLIQREKTRNL